LAVVVAFRLPDRLADQGLVATLAAFREGDVPPINSWSMSCGLFSRSAE
jgi:predicted enzyme involved in methoxymalonyl-ACP biosynthesis